MSGTAALTRRRLLRLVPAATAGLGLNACSAPRPVHRLAASEERGFYYEFAHLLGRAVERPGAAVTVAPRTTAGSQENLELLRTGAVDLALALADLAVESRGDLRAVGRMYLGYVQLAVPADSPVRTMSDLRGRTVMLGRAGSGTAHVRRRVLHASGVRPDEVTVADIP